VDSGFFAADGESCCFGLEALARTDGFGERFACSTTTFFGSRFVDFVGAFGGVRQNQYLVSRDLQEAAADRHGFLGAALFDAYDARIQGGQQWGVAGQNADDPFGAGRDNHIDGIFGIDFAFSGHDLDT
jgi:hypothetical protein